MVFGLWSVVCSRWAWDGWGGGCLQYKPVSNHFCPRGAGGGEGERRLLAPVLFCTPAILLPKNINNFMKIMLWLTIKTSATTPEWEFMNTILPKDSSLLHYAIHSCFYWRIFVHCMVFSDSSFLPQRGGGAGRESADHRGADRFDTSKTTLY